MFPLIVWIGLYYTLVTYTFASDAVQRKWMLILLLSGNAIALYSAFLGFFIYPPYRAGVEEQGAQVTKSSIIITYTFIVFLLISYRLSGTRVSCYSSSFILLLSLFFTAWFDLGMPLHLSIQWWSLHWWMPCCGLDMDTLSPIHLSAVRFTMILVFWYLIFISSSL